MALRWPALIAAGLILAPLTSPTLAGAAAGPRTFTVNTTVDAPDAHPGDGHCADAAGRCTLRAAVEEADALAPAGGVVILVPPGDYGLTMGTLVLGSPPSRPALSIVIDSTGGGGAPVVDAGRRFRVISVAGRTTATLEHLTLTDGNAGNTNNSHFGYGGGIYSEGMLTLFDVAITKNTAAAGGGVDNAGGSLVVTSSRISGNNGGGFGGGGIQNGGPANRPGSVLVTGSVVSDNRSSNEGGGIFSGQNGRPTAAGDVGMQKMRCPAGPCRRALPAEPALTLDVVDSVIAGNTGGNGGGGVASTGPATVAGSRIIDNSSGGAPGGGLFGVTLVEGSVLDGNRAFSGGGVEAGFSQPMTIRASTLDDNHAAAYGGAIDLSASTTVTRSTLAGNTAGGRYAGGGAAMEVEGGSNLHLDNSTVAHDSTTPAGGGAIDVYFGGAAYLSYDTLAGNSSLLTGTGYTVATATVFAATSAEPACQEAVHETAGFNLDSDRSCGLSLSTDRVRVGPLLGPLVDNGGPTETELPLPGSPLIDHGGLPATAGCPLVDQRGLPRPSGPACDIGAVEVQQS